MLFSLHRHPHMRIRKRQAVAEAETPLPISWKYQKLLERADMELGSPGGCCDAPGAATVCKGAMQEHGDEPPRPQSEGHGDELKQEIVSRRQESISDRGKEGLHEFLKNAITNTHRAKRRKIKHDSGSGNLKRTSAAKQMGVTSRLGKRTQDNSGDSLGRGFKRDKSVMNSKDALVSSIFEVFEAAGENGLTASEVVKIMTEQALPGLKEGGARHTVQVANVLRSSMSFISVGNKRYLLCSSLESGLDSAKQGSRAQHIRKADEDLSEKTVREEEPVHCSRQGQAMKSRRPSKVEIENNNMHTDTQLPSSRDLYVSETDKDSRLEKGDTEADVAKPRRRGPLVSQKDKGRTQCKRYDGRGWQCSRLTEPGYSLCVHHQDLINKRAAKLKEAQGGGKVIDRSLLLRVKIVVDSDSEGGEDEEINDSMPSESGDRVPAVPVQKRKMLSLTAIK